MCSAPGDEVLILAPFWPLIRGIVQAFRADAGRGPLLRPRRLAGVGRRRGARAAHRAGASRSTSRRRRTRPAACCRRAWLEALAELARREDLWLISDEVYEDYVYRGEHVSIARFAPERTLTVFSFSKAYGMAGQSHRLPGRAAAPRSSQAHKISTHTFYAAPTAGQLAGLRALARRGGLGRERARLLPRGRASGAARALGVPAPEGSTFLFLDVRERLDERGIWGFLEDCLDDGVALAPGPSCGEAYAGWVRLCFTARRPGRGAGRRPQAREAAALTAMAAAALAAARFADLITTGSTGTFWFRPWWRSSRPRSS